MRQVEGFPQITVVQNGSFETNVNMIYMLKRKGLVDNNELEYKLYLSISD